MDDQRPFLSLGHAPGWSGQQSHRALRVDHARSGEGSGLRPWRHGNGLEDRERSHAAPGAPWGWVAGWWVSKIQDAGDVFWYQNAAFWSVPQIRHVAVLNCAYSSGNGKCHGNCAKIDVYRSKRIQVCMGEYSLPFQIRCQKGNFVLTAIWVSDEYGPLCLRNRWMKMPFPTIYTNISLIYIYNIDCRLILHHIH